MAGPADGPPVILMHGAGQTRSSWRGAVREGARRGFRMISPDLRGHGESDWAPDGAYRLTDFAADLTAVADSLDQSPFLVGASLGGMTSLLHLGQGGRGRGLVMVDIVPRVEEDGAARIGAFMRARPNGFASLEEAADAVAEYLPHRERPRNVSGLGRNLRRDPDGRYRWHWDPRLLDDLVNSRRRMGPETLEAAARDLAIPLMLVRGRMSDVVSAQGARAFLDLVPHAEFADIAGADHMVAGDRNDVFNATVFDFLQRHRA